MAPRLLIGLFERRKRRKKHGTANSDHVKESGRAERNNPLHRKNCSTKLVVVRDWSLSFIFVSVGFAWMRPDFNREEIPDWRPVLARAEASMEKRELYEARSFYSRAARLASWREDWGGLLAAACGMKMLDHESGPYSNVHTILVRAMMAAERQRKSSGYCRSGGGLCSHRTRQSSIYGFGSNSDGLAREDPRFDKRPYRELLVRGPNWKRLNDHARLTARQQERKQSHRDK